jgi:hypothetical protein
MATSFYSGSFFGGEFFNMGGAAPAVKRRWAKIGKRVYHATEEEIRFLLSQEISQAIPVTYISQRQAKRIRAKQAKIEAPIQLKPEWDDEDDIEILLWH